MANSSEDKKHAGQQRDVFVSYTKADADFAQRLAEDLRSLGFTVWLDAWDLELGASIVGGVETGIDQSRWMIAILSPEALQSGWVLKELRAGLVKEVEEGKVYILPAVRKSVKLPAFLRDKFFADFRTSYEVGFALIRDRLLGSYRSAGASSWLEIRRPGHFEKLASELAKGLGTHGKIYSAVRGPTGARHGAPSVLMFDNIDSFPVLEGTSARHALHALHSGLTEAQARKDDGVTGTWFGDSGRLVLRSTDRTLAGEYDWHGVTLAGSLSGEAASDCLSFDWDWRLSTEKGSGVLWADIPNVLYGGWWMDFEDIDARAVVEQRIAPPNRWEFVRLRGLKIVPSRNRESVDDG